MRHVINRTVLTLILILAATGIFAAGTLTPKGSTHQPIQIRDHHVNVVINNGYAMTEVQQTFFNPNGEDLEAIYTFPLPKSASLSEVTIYVGEREIHGEVLEAQKAEQIYEEEKKKGNESGLAEKNEFYTFDFRVYLVRANDETRIRFLYYQPLPIDTGVGRYLYPLEGGGTDEAGLGFWTTNSKVENTFSVNLELKSAWPVQDVRIPGFEGAATVNQVGEGHYRVEMALTDASLNRDFLFYYRLADDLPGRVEVVPYKSAGDAPGSFMMVITPGVDLQPITHGSDYILVLDISGSMQDKLETLKRGALKALKQFNPEDRYRIITFNSNAREVTKGWIHATPDGITKADTLISSINSSGSTNVYAGLSLALKDLDDDRATSILLVTDGVTNTGIVDPVKFHKLMKLVDVRVFGFLLGNSSNWCLMETITETSGGFYDTMSNQDDIVGKILLARSKIRHEAMLDTRVKISGVKVYNLTDEQFGRVYRGEQLVIFGKYDRGGKAHLKIRATMTGEDKTYETDFQFPDKDTDNPELERLWAMATIEKIEAEERMGNIPGPEAESAISDLGVNYQLVTDYTSMVVLSDEAFEERGIERKNQNRIAVEQQARNTRAQQPPKSRRVDTKKPVFKFDAPNLGGGGGAIDPLTGLAALLFTGLGVLRLRRRNK